MHRDLQEKKVSSNSDDAAYGKFFIHFSFVKTWGIKRGIAMMESVIIIVYTLHYK